MRQVWIYLPPLFPTRGEPEERGRARELAEAAGFEIIDLTGAFDGIDVDKPVLEEWDRHPNARAHELIAGRQIGSAACREWVCAYGNNSMVAVSLKNKHKEIKE